jgi:hypothetical protein
MDIPTAARVNTAILDLIAAAYADLQSRSDRSSLATAHHPHHQLQLT